MEYDFDKALYRNIRTGAEYDKLIPAYSNTTINFEKSSKEILESDTFSTLKFINQWVDKYHGQMSKIAPLLKGKTTAETTNNIYSWLYNHIQYKLDTSPLKQRLFSPQAAWYYRASGIDCKSFSLLASCILTELKVPHSLRMVKQKGVRSFTDPTKWIVNPNYWSHVYVVVPDGNKTLIIDATTHDNREVQTVEKYDHKMIHQGLNGAYAQRNGLGCACQGTSLQKHGLGNPSTLGFAIANFHKYLNELERQGVSRVVTDRMLYLVRQNVENGIDPNMDEILKKATSGGQLGSIFGDAISQATGSVKSSALSSISNISVGGVKATDVAAAALGDPTAALSIAKGVISKILPSNFSNLSFGAVFANGFDITCINSATALRTSEVKKDIAAKHNPHFTKLITAIQNASTLTAKQTAANLFIKDVNIVLTHYKNYLLPNTDWSRCSRDGITTYIKFMQKLKAGADEMIAELISKGATVRTVTSGPVTITLEGKVYGKNNPKNSTATYQQLDFSTIKQESSTGIKDTAPSTTQTGVTDGQHTGTAPQTAAPKPKDDKGVNPLVLLSVAGLALKLLL
jgi:hypothetical protein